MNLNEIGRTFLFFLTIFLGCLTAALVLGHLGLNGSALTGVSLTIGFLLACGIWWLLGKRFRSR